MEKNMNNSVCMMAFAKGSVSTESTGIKRYIGVGSFNVLAVNPTKEELEKIYGTELENAPEYVSEKDGVKTVRIDFIVKTDPEKNNGIEMITKIPFFLRNEMRVGSQSGKIQVNDKYSRTAWATKEECQNHTIPMYKNGPANIDKDFRPCYVGEEALTGFIKTFLGIPNVMKYVNNQWVMVDHPEDCEARLEEIEKYFNNNFSELKMVLKLQPNNKIKALFGVRNTDDGKQYQTVFTEMFLKNNVSDYSRLDKALQERLQAGAYSTSEFKVCDLKEYEVEATNFSNTETSDMPFSEAPESNPFF